MGILGKFMDSMSLTKDIDDEEFLDDDFDDDFEDEEPAPKKKFFTRPSKADEDFDDEEDDEPVAKPRFFKKDTNKVVSINKGLEVVLIKPNSMEDSREICDSLLAGKTILLNMEGIHMEVAQRIIDFTCGATYSMDGKLQKISNYIFIATPSSVSLSGEFPELLADGSINLSGNNFHFN